MRRRGRVGTLSLVPLCGLIAAGCFALAPSRGGGETRFAGPRRFEPADVAVPAGYRIELVASGLTFPTGVAFDDAGRPHVVEAGYAYGEVWTVPRLLRVEPDGRLTPIAAGARNGPWTGVAFHQGAFYVAEGGELEGGRILRIAPDGRTTALVAELPSRGDHHTNGPAVGSDGWLYFGIGTYTNSAVVGEENDDFGWLKRFPRLHDLPCQDVTLTGRNFVTADVVAGTGRARTGAFVPFGTPTTAGQVIPGRVPCSGAVLRLRPEAGATPELVAWGFRNPFGLAFAPDGRLFVTDNSYDDRGSRPVHGAGDLLWAVQSGAWHGWPDFHGDVPLDRGDHYDPPWAQRPQRLLARPPNAPPRPAAVLPVHASANGFDFSRAPAFGHAGQAFVALFGDQAPVVGKAWAPVGFKVVRVDVATGVAHDFAVNRGRRNGPASWLRRGGLERPVAARFDPPGTTLYVVDFGVMTMTSKGSEPRPETGALWRITRTATAAAAGPDAGS
jgi:glucose/arabinose dehydrogenase